MKSKFTYLGLIAILLSACSTGSYVTSSYTDDIYFNPSDVPPPIVAQTVTQGNAGQQKSGNKVIVSEITENEDGISTMNNYIYEGAVVEEYPLEKGSTGPDTLTYYEDGELQYVINNYYDNDGNVDYAYRIRQFHNPYFYDPFFYNSWYYDPYYYSPGWSFSVGWGWGYPYYGYGYPYYGWGNPYYGWGYPGYGWGYYPPYYGGYPGYYPPIYVDSDSYQYGQRRSSGTNVARGGGGSSNVAQTSSGRNKSGSTGVSPENVAGSGRSTTSSSGRREASEGRVTTKSNTPDSNVLTERRRSTESSSYTRSAGVENSVNQGSSSSTRAQTQSQTQTQSYTRPGTSTQSRTYTRPSTSTSAVTSQPRVVNQSSTSGSSTSGYAQPKSTSTYNQTYRSSSTYNRSSSTGTSTRSSSTPASSTYRSSSPANSSGSSSGSYSTGSSGRSSGSYSSGSSGSSSSGGGSYSGGSSGGGGSRSSGGGGSSSSGRR